MCVYNNTLSKSIDIMLNYTYPINYYKHKICRVKKNE